MPSTSIAGRLRRRLATTALPAAFACLVALEAVATPRVFPTGVTLYDPARAYNSYIAFGTPDGVSRLIDMNGNEVHQWPYIGFPTEVLDPAVTQGALGHVLVQLSNGSGPWGGIFDNRTVAELDWEGRIVWTWGEQAPGGAARQNHDWYRLPNGNTLILGTQIHKVPQLADKEIGDQVIYEVDSAGKIVWSWLSSEHLDEFGFSADGLQYLRGLLARQASGDGTILTLNNMHLLGKNRWYDAGDQRFAPDNIIIDSREGNFVAIIEKATGKIVWRLGPYYPDTGQVPHGRLLNASLPRPVDQLIGQHDAHLIPEGLPGAGHLLVFDNQGGAGLPSAAVGIFAGSRVLEIDPVSQQIVWQYTGADSNRPVWSFHSSFISSARRLPNGNTLIDEGMNGRLFQITPDGDIVWEYVSPHFAQAALHGQTLYTNWVYRAQLVPYDWVPPGTPHSEQPVAEPDITQFRVPASR